MVAASNREGRTTGGIRKYIQINSGPEPGRQLSYIEYGSGDDVLVCVHGMIHNALYFDHIAGPLSSRYRVISVDAAGRGCSDNVSDYKNYTASLYVEDVLTLLDSLGIKKASWLGSSMGGLLGILISAARPELIDKLILNDIGPDLPDQTLKLVAYQLPELFKAMRYNRAEYLQIMTEVNPRNVVKNPVFFDRILQYNSYVDEEGFYIPRFDHKVFAALQYDISSGHNAQDTNDLKDAWSKIDIPVLVMWGKLSVFLTADIVKYMLDNNKMADITICECTECEHICDLMEPREIEVVTDWLAGNIDSTDTIVI